MGNKKVSQLIGSLIQLLVSQSFFFKYDRRHIRRLFHLRFK